LTTPTNISKKPERHVIAMTNDKTRKIVWAGLFTALITLTTAAIKIPTGNGYLNPGDSLIILSAFFLGPVWGAVASGFGAALADILAGYLVYAPATLIIKALMALVAGLILSRAKGKAKAGVAVFGAVVAEIIMIAGYFAYDAVFLGFGWAAIADVPGNIGQGIFGAVAGCALFFAFNKIPYVRDNF
jgi:uncharacterized membrane protein